MVSPDNVGRLQHVVQAFNDRNIDFLEQSVTKDFMRHDLAGAFFVEGIGSTQVANFLQALLGAFPDLRLDVIEMVPCGDRVTMRYQFSGTHTGELFGAPPTGRPVEFVGINIYRFEEEKIAEVWQLWDWATVLHQIGVLAWPRPNRNAAPPKGNVDPA